MRFLPCMHCKIFFLSVKCDFEITKKKKILIEITLFLQALLIYCYIFK